MLPVEVPVHLFATIEVRPGLFALGSACYRHGHHSLEAIAAPNLDARCSHVTLIDVDWTLDYRNAMTARTLLIVRGVGRAETRERGAVRSCGCSSAALAVGEPVLEAPGFAAGLDVWARWVSRSTSHPQRARACEHLNAQPPASGHAEVAMYGVDDRHVASLQAWKVIGDRRLRREVHRRGGFVAAVVEVDDDVEHDVDLDVFEVGGDLPEQIRRLLDRPCACVVRALPLRILHVLHPLLVSGSREGDPYGRRLGGSCPWLPAFSAADAMRIRPDHILVAD